MISQRQSYLGKIYAFYVAYVANVDNRLWHVGTPVWSCEVFEKFSNTPHFPQSRGRHFLNPHVVRKPLKDLHFSSPHLFSSYVGKMFPDKHY